MSEQLCLFEAVGEKKPVSPTDIVGETKMQAIQRFLDKGVKKEEKEPTASIEKYHPNGKKLEYYRLKYRQGKRVRTIHIPGGSTIAELAQYRAKKLQEMINRGAELGEVIAAVKTYRSGAK
jgi:hypothetical protein